ncbi:pyridoxal phosphate-dependent aminotransferase [Candidatus Pelagibacter bacterium]|jgi:aspartate aminotransferase|nr:pyridoxal phosphate-dependent aminotransferase [Candidatus Pelagibacter bacterium]MDA9619061.1 pyridoxal phosphate-dependent aminotransferase [Candidatus Pelagibacter bacterium]
MSIVSNTLKRIKPSPTIAVTQKARELKASGKDIIGLGAGEPDFDTPENIKQAAIKAIKDGDTKYTAVDGTPALKNAIINKFKRENNLEYQINQITVGAGGKHVIYNAMVATLNEGDEVIVPAPYWVSYPDIVLLAGGTPIILECTEKQGFKINPLELEKIITKKTKWIILNSPSNPTGACYSEKDIREIAKVLEKHPQVNILSDDIYEHVTYENFKFFTIAQIESLKDRVLTMNGVSKAYSMTGWRIGYAAGPKEIIKAIAKIQSQSTTNPSSISQAAAVEALNGTQDFIKERANSFQERRNFVVKALNEIDGIECLNPDGAFYVFPSCKGLIGKKDTNGNELKMDTDFVQSLLENSGVAVVQGSAFGLEGFFRISYATSMENLKKALEKISSFCKSLS